MTKYRYHTLTISLFLLFLVGCQSAYYSTMETVAGKHKRDILVDRVEDAQEAQTEAQQQFQSALEQLTTLIAFDGVDLQLQYEKTKSEYEASKSSADKVSVRINAIENVADALFEEWHDEIEQYTNLSLQRQSEQQLKETTQRYKRLIIAMHRAESKMSPVLAALHDNMLYLKHNLNANAIGALENEYRTIKKDIDILIKDMTSAIAESQTFIDSIKPNS